MFEDFVPESRETLKAKLEALSSGSDPRGIVPLPPRLAAQKLATLIRTEYPPVPEAEYDDIRALIPDLIVLGEKLATSDDLMTHWHGYGLLMLTTGMAVGMRHVPPSIFDKISSDNETLEERQLTARIVARFLCDVYPPVSDAEFGLLEHEMAQLTDEGQRQMGSDDYRTSMRGSAMLMLALGLSIGLRKIPLSIWKQYVPAQVAE